MPLMKNRLPSGVYAYRHAVCLVWWAHGKKEVVYCPSKYHGRIIREKNGSVKMKPTTLLYLAK